MNALVERIDDSLFEYGTRAYRLAAGLSDPGAPASLDELARPEVFASLTELLTSPRTDEGRKSRLTLLRRYAARAFVEAAAAPHTKEVEQALTTRTFTAAARTWTVGEALREGPRLTTREARAELNRAMGSALQAADGPWARRADTLLRGATALGHTMPTLIELMQGRPLAPRLAGAARLLQDTHDAFVDLLAFALRRLDSQLTLRTANQLDVERAAQAPWLNEHLPREDLQHALTRCVTDLGFNLSADGRLTVDHEPRPGRLPGAHVFELRVPGQVRLLLTADAGFEAWAGWLRAWGVALHRANVGPTLPFVERRLGDAAVVDGVGRLFESFLLEEGWLKRYLRLGSPQAREATRWFAFRQLLELRRQAALALVHSELCVRGAVPTLAESFVPTMRAALGGEVERGRTLLDLDVLGGAALSLDGWALEAALQAHLQERFNEDFYRNPATGRWLLDRAALGQRDDAGVIAHALAEGSLAAAPAAGLAANALEALDVNRAAKRRVALMGA